MHVVLAGGGSAGHVSPLLSTADALRRADPGVGISALGTQEGLESRLVPEAGYDFVVVPKVPLPRKPTPALVRVPGRLRAAIKAAGAHLDAVSASAVVGFGGYVSVPAYLAARKRGIPIVVHEANSRAGIANRLGARWAEVVAVTVPVGLTGEQLVGLPLRRDITTLDRAAARAEARTAFGLKPHGPVLLVTGGSLGARRLNAAATGAARELDRAGVQVLHVTGEKNAQDVMDALGEAPGGYHVVPYVNGMQSAYAASDLVLCRAGMNTCAELAVVGLPAVYVPLPIGNGEQALNAKPTIDAGGGLLVADEDVDPDYVTSTVLPLVLDEGRLGVMSQAVRRLGHPHADDELAALILEAAR
ncbi:MAG: UDP-diphospho-muramoylpentapeptide beta-N-acetylglucosaminyltransferase [Frankiales bacterium]|nr:UDP-diphospho-muramoylpentapeptide beta-N-acetylglucosaminyltransferase [Frankiales bacterium]